MINNMVFLRVISLVLQKAGISNFAQKSIWYEIIANPC